MFDTNGTYVFNEQNRDYQLLQLSKRLGEILMGIARQEKEA